MPEVLDAAAIHRRSSLRHVTVFAIRCFALAAVTLQQCATQVPASSAVSPTASATRPSAAVEPPGAHGPAEAIHYVSRRGNNADGRSWTTAWNELDQVDWTAVRPGDRLLIDGGDAAMTYSTPLLVEQSGVAGKPIKIALAGEPGRNGRAIIDGGVTYWPCEGAGTPPDATSPPATRSFGLDLNGKRWIEVDGAKWGGIEIRNHSKAGVRFGDASDIRLANLHIHHNTYVSMPDGPGISVSGRNLTLERLEINNNGQDAIQGGDVTNLVLQDSYLHDHFCAHPDGIQLFYGKNRGITVQRNTFAHGFLQAVFFGEPKPEFDSTTSDVRIQYNLIYDTRFGIVSNHNGNRDWLVYNNTIARIENEGISLYGSAGGMEVRNNILFDCRFILRNGVQSNNLFRDVPSPPVDENGSFAADPLFVNPAGGDFNLQADSPAIDRGVDIGLTRDRDNRVVPAREGVDIGAFEFGALRAGTIPLPQIASR